MRIYNLFPPLAGCFSDWKPHLRRAADLGFDWVFVNPLQASGRSGSLYSIKDYFAIDPRFIDPKDDSSPEQQVRSIVAYAEELGLSMMVDLVINHCAYDSPLLKDHPKWFVREGGKIAHPHCLHEGQQVVWEDLARFDFASRESEAMLSYFTQVLDYLGDLGFRGFRCDAAYQIPHGLWKRLMEQTRNERPGTVFAAETLGCSADQTKETARAGFDYIFNSSKWWDFSSPWLMEQYHLTRETVPSISFPESHDTPRLFEEGHGNVELLKQRYLFAALFSAGVLMPMGYEFGFRKPLHVVATRPTDWEHPNVDLSDYIRSVNAIKARYPVFGEESLTEVLAHPNPAVLVLWKASGRTGDEALLVLNKDPWNWQSFYADDLYQYVQCTPPLRDVSPEWPMEFLPMPFAYELPPGMGRVFVSG